VAEGTTLQASEKGSHRSERIHPKTHEERNCQNRQGPQPRTMGERDQEPTTQNQSELQDRRRSLPCRVTRSQIPRKEEEEVKKGLADKLGLTKKDDKKVEKPAAPAKDAKSEAKPAETAKETKPAPKEVKPESKPTPKADKPAPKAKPESKPAKKEKTEKEAIQDSFDSAKKLNELTNNAK